MKLLSIDHVPGQQIEALGMVKGAVVQTKHFARQIAVKRMVDEAKALDADAVIGIRYGSAQVMQGAAEVLAYGTAVKILGPREGSVRL